MNKLELRPVLSISFSEDATPEERFQNESLRSILKMQNNLYVLLFINYAARQNFELQSVIVERKHKFIEQSLQKDVVLKNMFLGMTVGMLTETEIDLYLKNPKVYNKRIITMLVERIKDQLK